MGLLKCCLLFGLSEFAVDEKDEDEMDTGVTDEVHALLIKCSHRLVAETLDEEATLIEVVVLSAPPVDGELIVRPGELIVRARAIWWYSALSGSIADVTVVGAFDSLAWLVDIKKWRISAKAR